MNTREREVMDALANALRLAEMDLESEGIGNETANRAALKAHDALLAEGSASSEGAEAVAPAFWAAIDPDGQLAHAYSADDGDDGEAARQEMNEWINEHGACCRLRPLYTNPQPAHGEHEQRTSERRPIADEVVERMFGGDPAGPRDDSDRLSYREAELCDIAYAKGREAAIAETNALREAAEGLESFVGVWFGDTNGNYPEAVRTPLGIPVKLRAIMAELRTALESAHPRGLPAGSDAKAPFALPVEIDEMEAHEKFKAYALKDANGMTICDTLNSDLIEVHDEIDDDGAYSWDEVGRRNMEYIAAALNRNATAEQPSYGQDARDATRYRALRDAPFDEPWSVPRIAIPSSRCVGEFVNGEDADTAIDAAIAAQQRQGGTK